MAISASLVKELRERTGSGMMECKKALVATGGDIEAAVEAMRKSGKAKADKKAGRIAAEGIIYIERSVDGKHAFMVEANCETDFVARDEAFKGFVATVAKTGLRGKITAVDGLLSAPFEQGNAMNIEQRRQELVAKLGENLKIRRVVLMNSETELGIYKHGDRIGVLVQLTVDNQELGKDLAMHIAASNPQAISPEDVPEAVIAKEKEIFIAQAENSGKPNDIIEKMVAGRIKKFLQETSLIGQPFVKDPNRTVADLLKTANAKVVNFIRFGVGEGIEKKSENFADEVMAQVHGSE